MTARDRRPPLLSAAAQLLPGRPAARSLGGGVEPQGAAADGEQLSNSSHSIIIRIH